MAEICDRKSVLKPRNYKTIVSSTREIRDPNPNSNRRFTSLFVAQNGSLLAGDADSKEVCIFNRNGKQVKIFSVDLEEYEDFLGIAELNNGNIVVCGYNNSVVKAFTLNGEFVVEFDQPDNEADELWYPGGMAVNNNGQLFVLSTSECKVLVYNEKGKFQYFFDCEGTDLARPGDLTYLCIGNNGLLYVTDCTNNTICVFQQNGTFVRSFGSDTLSVPMGIAGTNDGHIVVASDSTSKLSIFTTSGEYIHEVNDIGVEDPLDVAVDSNGFIYVTGNYTSVISVF